VSSFHPAPDRAASEVVGSILMVALTVAVAGAMVTVIYGAVPASQDQHRASLSASIHESDGGWGTGDETVRVSHEGGDAIPQSFLTVVVAIDGTETRYTDGSADPLDHAGQDAFGGGDTRFVIGDRWESPEITIPPGARVAVTVVDHEAGKTLWTGSFRAGGGACTVDTSPPTVTGWTQSPPDVDTETSGPVTVDATVSDNCGVDTSQDPHLHYRVNDGTDPAFTDAGAMSLQSGTTWQGSIPDQSWGAQGGDTLEYEVVDMADQSGNTGDSTLQQDEIEDAGARAYVQVPFSMDTGTAVNDAAARSADDGGAPATLAEEQTDEQSSTDEHYGSASSGTATTPANAEDEPDDAYATVDANGEAVTVTDVDTGSGDIVTVEIAVEGKHDGGRDVAQDDTITLSHDEGPTSERYDLDTTDETKYLEITGDKASWSWSDLQNLDVTATCTCHDNRNDEKVFSIDALWLRVEASVKTYELQTDRLTFDPLQGASPYTLELRYRTGGSEAFQAQVWDGSAWTVQSPNLDQASYTVFAEELTAGEVAAGPQIRILDTGTAQNTQGTLDLDYVRVVSS
jgi:flagellin-like protein